MKKKVNKSILNTLFRYMVHLFLCGTAILFCIICYFAKDLPDLHNLKTAIRSPSVTIQTYDGEIIGSYGDLYEEVVMTKDLPRHVPVAFMSIEDKRFLHHFGIDFIGFFRAAYQNFVSGRVVQGGSTLTQQLAKNILIGEGLVTHYDRSIARKVKELLLSIWLEYKFNKSQIMMMYLNRVYFGAGTYGIDAASRKYFGKSAKQLGVYESAVLAGILKAPSKYSPSTHANQAKERAFVVLKAMEEQGFIKDAKKLEKEERDKVFGKKQNSQDGNMYFCDFVYDQAKKILGGIEDDIIIVSTFDSTKQKAAEESIKYYMETEAQRYKLSQMAMIVVGRDGKVEAIVGGTGYNLTQFNRATQALRMPGSAFKIFVYGAALEYGYQLDDMISDKPITIGNWTAKNYKWKERGPISILDGFTYSVNSVCIRLAQQIGINRVAAFANKLGIGDISSNDMSVAIGTTALTLKDLTCAYTTFIDGLPIWSYGILEIRSKNGDVLYAHNQTKKKKIIDNETLLNCRRLLRSVVEKGTGRATNINPYIYGKTGSNGDFDAWFIGFYDPKDPNISSFSIGVWCGNDNNRSPMTHDSTGGRVPTRVAARFLKNILSQERKEKKSEILDEIIEEKGDLGSVLDNL